MADFCTVCSEKMGFGDNPDIDIEEIFNSLEPDHYRQVLCEGCTMCAIAKTVEGELQLADFKEQIFLPKKEFFEKYGNYI